MSDGLGASCTMNFNRRVVNCRWCSDAHFFDLKYLLPQFLLTSTILLSAVLATPALNDAENAIVSLSHPYGAQYSFRLLGDSPAANNVDGFQHIPVST